MELSLSVRKTVLCWWLAISAPGMVFAQANFATNGGEFPIVGILPGDQIRPSISISSDGGFVVWEDNNTDGDGQGISAMALDTNFSPVQSRFRINQIGAAEQERPQVSLLNEGGAVFVWQGGRRSAQRIYARFLSSSNTWATGDLKVNTFSGTFQIKPVVATLTNGDVVVAWSSFNQQSSNSLHDVYAQRLSSAGQKLGGEFQVNQFSDFNQRTPAVAVLNDGRFVLVWVSELQRGDSSVDIYARLFNADGTAAADEFLVNTSTNICANPSVAGLLNGGFVIAWNEKDSVSRVNGWDVYSRAFSNTNGAGPVQPLNTYLFGDQFGPTIRALSTGCLVVWTSMGQDGSWEGVYGRYLDAGGVVSGGEFRVNTTVAGSQKFPTVASDSYGRFLAAWASFTGNSGFDLFAQRYDSASFVPVQTVTHHYGPPPLETFTNNVPPPDDPPPTNGVPTNSVTGAAMLDFPAAPISSGVLSNGLTLAKGAYAGLFYDTNGVNVLSSGYFSVTTTERGTYSGKVTLGNRSWSISGRFDSLGRATNTIVRSGAGTLTVILQLDLSGGDQIRGWINDGSHWTAGLAGFHLVFNKTFNPAASAGNYTLLIPGISGAAGNPAGDGFGTIKLDASGQVQWRGTLADGTKVGQNGLVSKDGVWPLYVSLYNGGGSLLSWITFADGGAGGEMVWLKSRGTTTKYYSAGFTNAVEAIGSVYTRPASGTRAMQLINGNLIFSDGGLGAPFTNSISLGLNNKVTTTSSGKLTLNINTTSGLFKGSVLNPDTGKPFPFQGVLLENTSSGGGFFLGPQQSGRVFLSPTP